MILAGSLRHKVRALRRETETLYFALRDPRTPLVAKLLAGVIVAYALSPIDLIPDFIPVWGYLDDLILIPLGRALCLRLIPEDILLEARGRAARSHDHPKSYIAALFIILLWLAALLAVAAWLHRLLASD